MKEYKEPQFVKNTSEHKSINTGILYLPDKISHIKSRDFSVFYDQHEAVKKIGMNIPKGKVTAIIGPSGCGKSTFLRALNRMNDLIPKCHVKGNVFFEDQDIYNKRIDVVTLRKRIGMVFQKPNPFPKSIFDNIVYNPKIQGIRSKRKLDNIVETCLKDAAIWNEVKDRLDQNALGLSGGQQQRLCIARALAAEPDILLMDEPTSALDPMATAKIEELIEKLSENYTIVIVTHNMAQAARISHYTSFFYEGVLVEFNNTDQLFRKPKMKKTEDYITGRFG